MTKSCCVIGGGIFGCTAASIIGLDKTIKVTLFDPETILSGTTMNNQYRHHIGFHYPRSLETRLEIKEAQESFNSVYGKCIDTSFPSYYAIANDSKTSLQEFREIYADYNLVEQWPEPTFFNSKHAVACFRTNEGVYNLDNLRYTVMSNLVKSGVLVDRAEVTSVSLMQNGGKKVVYRSSEKRYEGTFDYVINATYAKTNYFREWLGFSKVDLIYRYKEIPIVRLPYTVARCAVTLIDGNYGTILPVVDGINKMNKNLYTVGDVELSILEEYTGDFSNYKRNKVSRHKDIIENCTKWFPILKSAVYQRSLFSILPIIADQHNTDGRPTSVTNHGFGCFSILSGKIMTAVQAALEIKKQL